MHTRPGSKAFLQGVDQGVSSLAAESAGEVIQSQTPHHTATETVLLQPLDLNLEALHVVVANPVTIVESIWHFLGGVPGLGGSILQEGADLPAGRQSMKNKDQHITHRCWGFRLARTS